ncbi:glutamine--tRNA ligase [Enterobacteriaceae endosymbiont of Macroplea mutica]|uniref:glutamine--tRNA ligase n=1 Tax=Enterobacteriaceae endosymbiont of Macroplea mutica TaxID=2675791 RepID=UPI0014498295|nr:glutamine--tRNA ligase [Enterobacteriaceae endosymbiont of Macroplea mutica]QJC31319.1 glutamine--tRNA ligase [Enterobacteriaceae endosymbiont of Macroplea mutica]
MNNYHNYEKNFIFKIIKNDIANKKYHLVHTRFPPEPNGYLHIGHLKSICLNFFIAEYFQGKCNLRIDDTNPSKENIKYVEQIKQDLIWLGFKWCNNIKYTSDYFDNIYQYAIELIKKNLAYVDELNTDDITKYRGTLSNPGVDSPYRNRSIQENLFLFNKMFLGCFKEGDVSLRAKIDMRSNVILMRDPVLYRIKYITHYKTGNKWCIYPTYDFAHCISDALEGITHSLCTLEFQDNRILYNWILQNINIQNKPKQYEFSKLNIEYALLTKRKINILLKNKIINSWDDPRLFTISGLRRRGYTASALRNFCYNVGVTKQNNLIEITYLESYIRNELNQNAVRRMAVLRPLKLIIVNFPQNIQYIKLTAPNHPNDLSKGYRDIFFTKEIYIDKTDFLEHDKKNCKKLILGHEIRLRYAYVIKAIKILKDAHNNIICLYCNYDMHTLGIKLNKLRGVKGVIHWISTSYAIKAYFYIYDYLFTQKNINYLKDILSVVKKKTLIRYYGFIEQNILYDLKFTKHFQFEREGYFFLDMKNKKHQIIFNRITTLKK